MVHEMPVRHFSSSSQAMMVDLKAGGGIRAALLGFSEEDIDPLRSMNANQRVASDIAIRSGPDAENATKSIFPKTARIKSEICAPSLYEKRTIEMTLIHELWRAGSFAIPSIEQPHVQLQSPA